MNTPTVQSKPLIDGRMRPLLEIVANIADRSRHNQSYDSEILRSGVTVASDRFQGCRFTIPELLTSVCICIAHYFKHTMLLHICNNFHNLIKVKLLVI